MAISRKSCQATVVSTTICHLSARDALDFAEYLESQKLAETLLDQHILDCTMLKESSEEGFFLDQMLIAPVSPDAVQWMRDRRCHRFAGCRVALYEAAAMDNLLEDYQGGPMGRSGLHRGCGLSHQDCNCSRIARVSLHTPDGATRSRLHQGHW